MLSAVCLYIATLGSPFVPPDSAVVVRSVRIEGNHRTRERIVRREMELHPGDTVLITRLAEKLAWDQRKISNTNLFITVDVAAVPAVSQRIDVAVTLKERMFLFAFPTFFLADRNFSEWWYERNRDLRRTVYGGRMYYKNLTGNNDRLRAILEFGFLTRADLTYSLPYLDRAQKTGISVGASYVTNKEIAYRSRQDKLVFVRDEALLRGRFLAGLVLTRRNRFYAFHRAELRYSRTSVADTIARLNPDYFLNGRTRQRYVQVGYTYTYDRRDNVAYPLKGLHLDLSADRYGLLPTDDLHQTDLQGSLSRFWPLSRRWFVSSTVAGKVSWPQRQPYFNLRGLGYQNEFVRGYELYVIDGQRYGLVKNTLRFQLLNTRKTFSWIPVRQFSTVPLALYLTAFGDAGFVHSSLAEQYQSRFANRWLGGAGLGLDVVTFYNAVFQLNYAVNRRGETGFYFTYFYDL